MSSIEYDYLIVGQGLAGSVLSYLLIQNGEKILVIDKPNLNSSSKVAAGLFNPVTGRRVVKSWMADTLLPFAKQFYNKLENEFGKKFFHPMDVLEVILTVKELNDWTTRTDADEMRKYFTDVAPEAIYRDKICDFKRLIRINSSGWMDITLFIELVKKNILSNSLIDEEFDHSKLIVEKDHILYENIRAKKIIFCEGHRTLQNKLWNWLPLVPAKGEILTIECKDLPHDHILLSGIFIVPLGENKFRVGSTYEWNFPDELPTEAAKIKLKDQLSNVLKVPFQIIDHRAGVRPTVKDRRPSIGKHPDHENVFIFNGMGTKGVQLMPYFGEMFVEYLSGKNKLIAEVDIGLIKIGEQISKCLSYLASSSNLFKSGG